MALTALAVLAFSVTALVLTALFLTSLDPTLGFGMLNLLYTLAGFAHTVAGIAGLVLLILGATFLARGRVDVWSLPEVTGLRARLIGLGFTVVGAALWLL